MIPQDEQRTQQVEMTGTMTFTPHLPPGAAIQQIAFVSERIADQELLLEFPTAIQRRAVLVTNSPDPLRSVTPHDLLLLTFPTRNGDANGETQSEVLSQIRDWADAATSANNPTCLPVQSLLMTLQGTQIFWNQGRLAILAPPDRLDAVRKALVEVSYYEAELRDIERTLGETWPQLEADMPLAFEFEARSVGQRKQLRRRFQQVLLLRARLARIAPYVHCPHLHPPTLASQAGERLRERTQMVHRHEFLGEQIGVFERVYEMCGQRASDFMLTRSGNTLEWIIIVLLLSQLLIYCFELLTSMGK